MSVLELESPRKVHQSRPEWELSRHKLLRETITGSNKTIMPVHRDSEIYNMSHPKRGRAVIFNHENFHSSLDLGRRYGTERDKVNLKATLSALGFEVITYDDLSFTDLIRHVEKFSKQDHKEYDCFVMVVLSHGDTQLMYAQDYSYKPDLLWNSFTADKCSSLAGKPKIFLIQACQGNQLDEGTKLVRVNRTEVDSNPQSYKIPNHADFLITFSTVPGFYSWRNTTNGSWFVQAICTVLNKYASKKDLLSMMTIVAREVALNFESNTPSLPHMNQKKQIPFITSTLIRDIYLVPK
jgi:caspase-like apoptosis-related cysteine protease